MISGPAEFFKCPNCGQVYTRGSLISGNSSGEILYSDGKSKALMNPDFPLIEKCKNCGKFFWLDYENQIEINKKNKNKIRKDKSIPRIDPSSISEYYKLMYSKFYEFYGYVNIYDAHFLTLNEYQELIDSGFHKNDHELKYFRNRLWWAYNDKFRKNNDVELTNEEETAYENNCLKLIEILDINDIDEKLMIAELYRNIGNFTECKNILSTIDDEERNIIRDTMKKECNKNNKKTVIIPE